LKKFIILASACLVAGIVAPSASQASPTPAGTLSVVAGDEPLSPGPPIPGPATQSPLNNPTGVAVDAHGDLFIADIGNNVVEEVSPGGTLSVVAGVVGKYGPPTPGPATKSLLGTAFSGPVEVTVDSHGDLFIADAYNRVVEEVSPAGRLSVVAGNGTQGQAQPAPGPATKRALSPGGLAVNAHGDLFISDGGAGWGVVVEVSPAGTLSVVAGNSQEGDPTPGPATQSSLREPEGLAVSASGDLYIADTANFVVEKVTF
jgi:hypothetical protein